MKMTLVYKRKGQQQREVEFAGSERHCWESIGKFVTYNQPIEVIATRTEAS